jgi:hypothetical protein
MKKICTLIISLLFVGVIAAQKLPNPKIGKNEMEITFVILDDVIATYGGQLVYRIPAIKKLKLVQGSCMELILDRRVMELSLQMF